jgi:hypothetical protein
LQILFDWVAEERERATVLPQVLAMAGTVAEPTFMTGSRFKPKVEDEVKQLR